MSKKEITSSVAIPYVSHDISKECITQQTISVEQLSKPERSQKGMTENSSFEVAGPILNVQPVKVEGYIVDVLQIDSDIISYFLKLERATVATIKITSREASEYITLV